MAKLIEDPKPKQLEKLLDKLYKEGDWKLWHYDVPKRKDEYLYEPWVEVILRNKETKKELELFFTTEWFMDNNMMNPLSKDIDLEDFVEWIRGYIE